MAAMAARFNIYPRLREKSDKNSLLEDGPIGFHVFLAIYGR